MITCYVCGVEGHEALKCMERQNAARRNEAKTQVTQEDKKIVASGNVEVLQQEQGENIMFKTILFKPKTKAGKEPEQRKRLFKTK